MQIHRQGIVSKVAPGSVAERIGLRIGDRVVKINGHELLDVLDFQFFSSESSLIIDFMRDGDLLSLGVEKDTGESLGVEFDQPTFNGIRQCANNCLFCFVDGLPTSMRSSLYVKDDDYRYGFLYNNFLTLTNLGPRDWRRLEEQKLSPLYVSVHSTETELRRKMLGNPKAPDIIEQLKRLAALRIEVHAQIVLCPGINDGPALHRTLRDLAALYPGVQSVAIVPVGLTKFNGDTGARSFLGEEASDIIDSTLPLQQEFRTRFAKTFAYLADEFYILAERDIPPHREYDDYPLYQNGIGLTRTLLDEAAAIRRRHRKYQLARGSAVPRSTLTRKREQPESLTLVCGKLIAPFLGRIAEDLSTDTGAKISILSVENHFFGDKVTVSGLLTGRDVIRALQVNPEDRSTIILPRAMLDSEGARFLDDLKPVDIAETTNRNVMVADSLQEVVALLKRESRTRLRNQRRLY